MPRDKPGTILLRETPGNYAPSAPLRIVLNNNKRDQEAGCSAFATFEEDAGTELAPYLEPVLRNLVFAFEKYQHKNMLILYDAVGTLADARWSKLKDDDEDLIPLLECLASVTIAIGPSFLPYAGPIFDRCLNIAKTSIVQYQTYQQNPDLEWRAELLPAAHELAVVLMFQGLLSSFKAADTAGWQAQVSTFPPVIQERLAERYGV
ncbi:hypothetical protein DENSPDRAFT_933079 [Dentipellis sp. KUC8613]|nr:hypothetical protein DENSPDRAFT_933079 [Dentipellis sp. KUC8613]